MFEERRKKLRMMMSGDELIWGPGVFDGLSASIADTFDFPILYMTGGGTSVSRGYPDLGLISLTEMVQTARTITSVSRKPVIADADTGYGNVANVIRTVQEYEAAGVAGIHIEDQVFPKKCGHLEDKSVISRKDFTDKIRAASRERYDKDFVIIARTDSRAPLGLDEALTRIGEAFDAGADVGFLEAIQSEEEAEKVISYTSGKPMLYNMATNGKSPNLSARQIYDIGFRFAIWPITAMAPAIKAMRESLELLYKDGVDSGDHGLGPADVFEAVGLKKWMEADHRYSREQDKR